MTPCFLNLGTGELIVIFLVIILLFGAKRIPELARSMGKGISMFKHGMNEAATQINETPETDAKAKTAPKATSSEEEKK